MELRPSDRMKSFLSSYDVNRWRNLQMPPYNPDALIADKGYDEMDRMYHWADYAAPMAVKKQAVLHKQWEIRAKHFEETDPRSKRAEEAADLCRHVLYNIRDPHTGQSQNFRTVLWNILDACHIGFSVQELVWKTLDDPTYKGKWGIGTIVPRRAKQVGFFLDEKTMLVKAVRSYVPHAGAEVVPAEKCVLYSYKPQYGLPYGQGDARACYKLAYSGNDVLRMYLIALQRFGMPFLKAHVDNPSPAYVRDVQAHMDDIQQGASAVFPNTITVDVVQASNGNLDSFHKCLEQLKVGMAELILGQSLTTHQGTGPGSYSLGVVHQDTQEYFLSFVRKDLEDVVEQQILRRIVLYNFGKDYEEVIPEFSLGVWDVAERKLIADFLGTLIDRNVVHPQEPVSRHLVGLEPTTSEVNKKLEEMTEAATKPPAPTTSNDGKSSQS